MFIDFFINISPSSNVRYIMYTYIDIRDKQSLSCICKKSNKLSLWTNETKNISKSQLLNKYLRERNDILAYTFGYNNIFEYKLHSCCSFNEISFFFNSLSNTEKKKLLSHLYNTLYKNTHSKNTRTTRLWKKLYWKTLRNQRSVMLLSSSG